MVSIKMTFCWQPLIIVFVAVSYRRRPVGGATVAPLRWEEASLEPAHFVRGCDVFPGACTDHSAVHQRGIMTIYIQQFPYIKFSGAWPSCGRF